MSKRMPQPPVERLVADNVPEAIWLRLRRLTSSQLCRKIIAAQAPNSYVEVLVVPYSDNA